MKSNLLLLLLVGVTISACTSENAAIEEAAITYMEKQGAVQEMTADVEAVEGNYARVLVTPINQEADPAIVFLKKEQEEWQGLLYGTAFGPEEMQELGIPEEVWAE